MGTELGLEIDIEAIDINPYDQEQNQVSKEKKKKKRAGSPFIEYCKVNRAAVQRHYSGLSSRVITKILASQWKKMSSDEKNQYSQKQLC